jgi:hypothetical protein
MRARGTSGQRPPEPSDRELWRRSRDAEAPFDEAERLMELAAFADNRLDEDDAARVAALISRDADAADDVAAAARMLAAAAAQAADAGVVARAAALAGASRQEAVVLAFPPYRSAPRAWRGAASWSGLAAAVLFAGWLGFDLGSGLSSAPPFGHSADEASAGDILDPSPLLLRDISESSQI